MKLFVDSVDPDEIGACVASAGTTGVAARATLLVEAAGRAGHAPADLLRAICAVANGPVCVELAAPADDREALLTEARGWAAVAASVVVRLPGTDAGMEAVRACVAAGIRTAIGGCRSPEQALAAVRAGASQVWAPPDQLRKLVALLRTYDAAAQVIAAPLNRPTEVIDAGVWSADVAVATAAVLRGLPAESVRHAETGRR